MSKIIDLQGLKTFLSECKKIFVLQKEGKDLSTCDYTREEKDKLANLNNYTLPIASSENLGGVKVGTGLTIIDGKLSTIPVDLSNYAKKSDIAKAVKYKGSLDKYSDLPKTNMAVGDMYNIVQADKENSIKAGDNVVYNGDTWDNFGGTVDLSNYATKDDVQNAVLGGLEFASVTEVQTIFEG